MNLSKNEVKNMIGMLKSKDFENATIAFCALEELDMKNSIGELIVMYKFSNLEEELWKENAPKSYKLLKNYLKDNFSDLKSGRCLSLLMYHKCSKDSIELFMEYFTAQMMNMIENMDYPVDKFELIFKLKDND